MHGFQTGSYYKASSAGARQWQTWSRREGQTWCQPEIMKMKPVAIPVETIYLFVDIFGDPHIDEIQLSSFLWVRKWKVAHLKSNSLDFCDVPMSGKESTVNFSRPSLEILKCANKPRPSWKAKQGHEVVGQWPKQARGTSARWGCSNDQSSTFAEVTFLSSCHFNTVPFKVTWAHVTASLCQGWQRSWLHISWTQIISSFFAWNAPDPPWPWQSGQRSPQEDLSLCSPPCPRSTCNKWILTMDERIFNIHFFFWGEVVL